MSNNNRSDTAVFKKHTKAATAVVIVGCIATGLVLPANDPDGAFRIAAMMMTIVLAVALGLEARSGFRSLLRTDVLMLVVLYGLTLLEFVFPQDSLAGIVSPESSVAGTQAVLLGFVGIAVGRHLVPPRRGADLELGGRQLSSRTLYTVFLISCALGYLHIFVAVDFDIPEALRQMTLPRFSQEWSRGRLGDWTSLLTELDLLIYLLPPIAG